MTRKSRGWGIRRIDRIELRFGLDTPFAVFIRRERQMRNQGVRSFAADLKAYSPELQSIDGSYISRWECSRGLPQEDRLESLALFFGIPFSIFCGLLPTIRYIELDCEDLLHLATLQKDRSNAMAMTDLGEAVMKRRQGQHEVFWNEYWENKYQTWLKLPR